jgi:hypothetical protein
LVNETPLRVFYVNRVSVGATAIGVLFALKRRSVPRVLAALVLLATILLLWRDNNVFAKISLALFTICFAINQLGLIPERYYEANIAFYRSIFRRRE